MHYGPLETHPAPEHEAAYLAALLVLQDEGITEESMQAARQAAERASQPRTPA
jgi:hypothetical protein